MVEYMREMLGEEEEKAPKPLELEVRRQQGRKEGWAGLGWTTVSGVL